MLKRHHMGDQVVDVDLAFHVPINDLRTSVRPSTPKADPFQTRPASWCGGANFLTSTGDTDNDANAPAFVATPRA